MVDGRRRLACVLVAFLLAAGCSSPADPSPPRPTPRPSCGLVEVPDGASYAQYSVDDAKYWDVTMAVLKNSCSHSVDIVQVELGASMGLVGQGASVVPLPENVFAAASAPARPLTALQGKPVAAGQTVQVIGRFSLAGEEPVRIPTATLAFRDGTRTGTITLTPRVSLCTCPPPP